MAKIMLVYGTRPEAIKCFPIAHALAVHPDFTVINCVTAQHREMLDQVLDIGEITPDHDLDLMRAGQSLDEITARLLTHIGAVLDQEQPDYVLVQGDTATAMCGALAAYYRRIPIGHIEAGLRSGNIYHPWPEEVNRKIIGSMARLHFAPTPTAAEALKAENINPNHIHITGNSVIDALHFVLDKIKKNPELAPIANQLAKRFAGKKIIGVTSHRRENFGGGLEQIASAISHLAKRDDVAVIFPLHLNPEVRKVMEPQLGGRDNIALIEPMDYCNFARLQQMADIMLSDSGGVQEEAPALGTPVLVMRETTERPEGIAAGTAKLVGTDSATIIAEAEKLLDDAAHYAAMSSAHNPFGKGDTAQQITDILQQQLAEKSA